MIELKNLYAGYPGRPVLQNVSLSFIPGEVLVLAGPNGCGKSTLLKAALGLLPKTEGKILYDNTLIETIPPRLRAQKAAFLTQSRTTPCITAQRMVLHGRFPYLSYPRRYRSEDYVKTDDALRTADAAHLAAREMTALSGGQRQNVYLAMALAQETETILLDEPTTYLDIAHQLRVMEMAHRLAAQGRAVVLVLHDLPLALRTADRLAVMEAGRVRICGTPGDVYGSGVLDEVFGVRVRRADTAEGPQYFCLPK